MERRRLAAARDLRRGMRKVDVARKHRVSYVSVWRWETRLGRGGDGALRLRRATGRPPKLNPLDLRKLGGILDRGASFSGGSRRIWTSTAVACLIRSVFRVRYHVNHVPRLLRKMEAARTVRGGGPILRD